MLKIEFLHCEYRISGVCVICGTTFIADSTEAVLRKGNKRIGNVCAECVKKGSERFPKILREQARKLKEKAKMLEEFSQYEISCPEVGDCLPESGRGEGEKKERSRMIMSRVLLIGEGVVPREEIEGVRSEHMKIFLTEYDPGNWPGEILHLKKYAEMSQEEIDIQIMSKIDKT